jgi:hypothetical protein
MKQVDEGGYQDQDLFANVWTWGASLLADDSQCLAVAYVIDSLADA